MLKRIEVEGEAILHKGDPRLAESNMDAWYQDLLVEVGPAKMRPYLYGADAGLCARRNVLLEHNEWMATSKGAATQAYMAIGVGLEGMLAKSLQRHDLLVAQQVRLPIMPEVYVSGFIDLVHFDCEEKLAITEVKTCGKLPAEANPVHLAQVQFYAAATGLHHAWLTYISRNVRDEFGQQLSIRTFPVDTSEKTLRSRLLTAAISRLAADEGRLTPVPAHFRKHTECHYCEFRDAFCWAARPGLGGAEPVLPLPQFSPSAMIRLEQAAQSLADSMWSNSEPRFRDLLVALTLMAPVNPKMNDKLKSLL